MTTYTYQEWIDKYKPTKNQFFPEAEYDGTLYYPQNFGQIGAFVQTKKLWSLVIENRIVNKETQETREYRHIYPGFKVNGIGYFITIEPFESLYMDVQI